MTRLRPLAVLLAFLALPVGCGEGAQAPTPPEREAPAPARLVQVDAKTEYGIYDVCERVVVRRTFENVGGEVARMDAAAWSHRRFRQIGIATKRSSGLYDTACVTCPEVEVAPGARVEIEVGVELAAAGACTLDVPPAYLARDGEGEVVRLRITVVDRGDPRLVDAKVERLGRRIADEGGDDPRLWTEAQNDLEAVGAAAIPHLRRWLREAESAHLRGVAAKLLWRVRGEAGVEELVAALEDEVATVRKACLDSLGTFRVPATLDAILPLLRDEDLWVRIEAITTVSAFDDERVLPALRSALEDEDPLARRWAAVELAEAKDATGIRVLIAALEEDPVGEAFLVADALETLTGEAFGEAPCPGIFSCFDQMEEAAKRCETVAAKWLEWWEIEGRARYGR